MAKQKFTTVFKGPWGSPLPYRDYANEPGMAERLFKMYSVLVEEDLGE